MRITIKCGTAGKQETFTLDRPATVSEFIAERGYTEEAVNAMLMADDKRRLQSFYRSQCDEDGICQEVDIVAKLDNYIFTPGRKPSEKTSKKKASATVDSFSIFAQLAPEEIGAFQQLSREEQEDLIASYTTIEDLKERLSN